MVKQQEGLSEYMDIRYLKPEECIFSRTTGGFIALKVGEDSYKRVNLSRAFPLTYPTKYISVRDSEMNEIGIIEDMTVFPDDARAIMEEELERRYFTPLITAINSIKEEFGYTYWEVETDRGGRRFTVRGHENVIPIKNNRVLIIDVDGNRFEIEDYKKLDAKSYKLLDALV